MPSFQLPNRQRATGRAREPPASSACGGDYPIELRPLFSYFLESNLHRMRYDQYLAFGYPIATGVIEGACRHIVKDRMERAGMRWKVPGAQAMLELRVIYTNGDWKAFQAYRIEQETKRLYPRTQVSEPERMAA
jgi:hypothetical protein